MPNSSTIAGEGSLILLRYRHELAQHAPQGCVPYAFAMQAAIFRQPFQPLSIESVDIDRPIGREVLVRTVATGVCHSDLHFVDGYYPFPTPAILGHEAAGIVEEV